MNLKAILNRPIPDQSFARSAKAGYRSYPILADGIRAHEPLVDIETLGIAGQSYYSRPNSATGEPVAGVASAILVRQGIAEKLAEINYALQESSEIRALFGRPVELYVDEGYRSLQLQHELYENVFPRLIRKANPDWTPQQILSRRDELSAPQKSRSGHVLTAPPHATGAAVDLRLRYQHPNLGYQPGTEVDMGHTDADVSRLAEPDYFEHVEPGASGKISSEVKQVRRNRRIFYWVMRGALTQDDTGFIVNPTEWWHWSYGDQMWAQLTQAPEAFYSFANRDKEDK